MNASAVTLATIEGALVALPCPAALDRLRHLRSPAWALVAPGSLIFGTFGVLALPPLATGLALLATLATPVLAAIAMVGVVHGRQGKLLVVPVALGLAAAIGAGWPGQLAASLLTALGCLTLGAAFVRLTPARWLYVGVLSMGIVDVLLLGLGIGQPAAALLYDALGSSAHPVFHRAQLGSITLDYPDLVLAAVVGGIVAGRAVQPRAAVLAAMLAAAYELLLTVWDSVPATVPLALVLLLVEFGPRVRLTRARRPKRGARPAGCASCGTAPVPAHG